MTVPNGEFPTFLPSEAIALYGIEQVSEHLLQPVVFTLASSARVAGPV
jgi:hypothetical protein